MHSPRSAFRSLAHVGRLRRVDRLSRGTHTGFSPQQRALSDWRTEFHHGVCSPFALTPHLSPGGERRVLHRVHQQAHSLTRSLDYVGSLLFSIASPQQCHAPFASQGPPNDDFDARALAQRFQGLGYGVQGIASGRSRLSITLTALRSPRVTRTPSMTVSSVRLGQDTKRAGQSQEDCSEIENDG